MVSKTQKSLRSPALLRGSAAAFGLIVAATLSAPSGALGQTEGDYLYNVTMVRAAPGHFVDLISALEESASLTVEAGDQAPFWIRHSQGDQWDFMLIYPMGDQSEYHSLARVERRASAWESTRGQALSARVAEFTAHREEWFAGSVALAEMRRRFDGMGFFHVEMFAGLPGKRAELVEQRRMENRYYEALERQQNVIWVREAGPNWDAMTIGFYRDLTAFAAAGVRYTESEQEVAARAAGFEGVGEISPYLRSLLSYHHDTLGVRIR